MNTYAELYGNIKKELIKNGSANKLASAKVLADNPIFGAVNNFIKEGDAMNNLLDIHKSPLAHEEVLGQANRLASAFNDSTIGMSILCPVQQ